MLDFGEELTSEGLRIPWFIWIQLLVFLLLLAFLFCLSIIALDPSHYTTSACTTDSDLHTLQPSSHHFTAVTNRLQNTRGNTCIKGEIANRGNTGIVREEIAEGETSTSSLNFLHPCYYFKLAKSAFLKCFRMDFTSKSDDPSDQRYRRTKESWL